MEDSTGGSGGGEVGGFPGLEGAVDPGRPTRGNTCDEAPIGVSFSRRQDQVIRARRAHQARQLLWARCCPPIVGRDELAVRRKLELEGELRGKAPGSAKLARAPQVRARQDGAPGSRDQDIDCLVGDPNTAIDPEGHIAGQLLKVVELRLAVLDAVEVYDVQDRIVRSEPVDHVERVESRGVRRSGNDGPIRTGHTDLSIAEQHAGHQRRSTGRLFASG